MPSEKRRFAGKCVVVTGASSGIGAATARAFAREGARVALVAGRAEHLALVALELRGEGGDGVPFPADLGEAATLPGLVDQIRARLGAVDVLVNAADTNERDPIGQWTHRELTEIITLNLTAPIALTRLVLPHMRSRGGGAVVSVASLAARFSLPGAAVYSATQLALQAFTFALAEELEAANVHASVVLPSPSDGGPSPSPIDPLPEAELARPPMSPADVAAMILACAAHARSDRRAMPLASAGHLARGLSALRQRQVGRA
jgi:short-subunit dehydrogenase